MAAITYQLDSAHSHAQFKVRHMMISNVRGEFYEGDRLGRLRSR